MRAFRHEGKARHMRVTADMLVSKLEIAKSRVCVSIAILWSRVRLVCLGPVGLEDSTSRATIVARTACMSGDGYKLDVRIISVTGDGHMEGDIIGDSGAEGGREGGISSVRLVKSGEADDDTTAGVGSSSAAAGSAVEIG